MHCPRCGTSTGAGQQFCRACGLGLEKIAEILGEEEALQSQSVRNDVERLRERQKRFENVANLSGLTTFSLILLLLIVVVFTQMILRGGLLIIPGTLLILLAIGAGSIVFFGTYSKALKAKLEEKPLPPSSEPLSIEISEASALPPGSVVEGTTELLTPAKNAETGRMNT